MKLGYTILYVSDVAASLAFYGAAFGLQTRFAHDSGTYAELETGSTVLAFAAAGQLDATGAPAGRPDPARPVMEIALVTDDVPAAVASAQAAGAAVVQEPKETDWGQIVAYVSDPDGFWVELCTPVPG